MSQIIESISYPCPTVVHNKDGATAGVLMKNYFVGIGVMFSNNEASIVSSIAPAEGGGYAVTFDDERVLLVKDHPQMEVLYKPLEEDNGDQQDNAESAGV